VQYSSEWLRRNSESSFYFCPQNRIPVIFSFAEVSERNFGSSFYFCSTERNSELFSLPRKGSERNSESFLFRGTAGIPSEIPICSSYFIFRGIMFCRKFPTLVLSPPDILLESCGLFSEWLLILYLMKLSNSF
jgi:hypothetical protein